mmetsp:Transcript_81683/g.189727  ORF Transcript_81683/g.189727 Transcript_81683/m.189727 type:complete len:233 (+) Transcript_81683:192-890(+)
MESTATSIPWGWSRQRFNLHCAPVGLPPEGIAVSDLAGTHQVVNLGKEPHESCLHIGRLERGGLDARETMTLSEGQCLVLPHSTKMSQVPLIPYEHDDNVWIGVVAQLLEPPLKVLEGHPLGNVIDEQRTHSSSVVRTRDGPVPLLPRSVPDLCFDDLAICRDALGCELNTDGRLGLEIELITREPRQQVRFANPRVTDQHHLEEIVVVIVLGHNGPPVQMGLGRAEWPGAA